MNILFTKEASLELDDAVIFYELEQKGLGLLFKREVKRMLLLIRQYPEIGPTEDLSIRHILLHKFPHKILYSIEVTNIIVLAIAHQHRKPNYWVD
ncbi:MAG: type II toxin-antitoxin system RelE/ParE family toxin [Planctomycetes bacterium]|nr:type II toxin-antitoxin system RelE/ParE family toxin [Planctomycetota bacterium]